MDTPTDDWHEHPFFNGQYHKAVWCRTWADTDTTKEPPPDAPIQCAICGKMKEGE